MVEEEEKVKWLALVVWIGLAIWVGRRLKRNRMPGIEDVNHGEEEAESR